jgi:hypothetical protein
VRFRALLDCPETAEIAVVYRRDRVFSAMAAFLETVRGIEEGTGDGAK